jgi:hypothetical protein
MNFANLVETVQRNCHISDARHAGNYTMCTFLLKMRELYRWEHNIPLTTSLPRDDIGNWLRRRENDWHELEAADYEPLQIGSQSIDPFDTEAVNEILIPEGHVYHSGLGLFGKPHFFLGRLYQQEHSNDTSILVSSREYARDLVAPPAMMRDSTIFISRESVRRYIWEKIEEWQFRGSHISPLSRALDDFEQGAGMEDVLDLLTDNISETMILHELGEFIAGEMLGDEWQQMLLVVSTGKAEMIARAARDLLADCLVVLPALIETGNTTALHFYFAGYSGLRRSLYPEAVSAYEHWIEHDDLSQLRSAARSGIARWQRTTTEILELYGNARRDISKGIEALLGSV